MKKILWFVTLFIAIYLKSSAQQSCLPTDSCGIAPKLCMNGFITTTAGYTAGSEQIICPNGQQWGVHNDLWIAFVPTQSSLEITVDVIGNCSAGNGVQALIHDNCATDPIDCDVACQGNPSVGASLTFIPGKTYYLRIDGCSGAVCPIQITTFPANAIQNPNGPLIPELTILSGPSLISCPSENVYTYCANPFNDCATQFLWKIESGNAIITDTGDEIIDYDPVNPGTNITKSGKGRQCINVKFPKTGSVNISVQGTNGCQFTKKIFKTILINELKNIDTAYAYVCPFQQVYENDNFPGSPFLGSDTCGKFKSYDIVLSSNIDCVKKIKLFVGKTCDTLNYKKDLGDINVCSGGNFQIFNKFFNFGGKFSNVNNQMTFPDSITKSCPIIYSGNLVNLNLDPTISVNGSLNKCKKDTVTLIGNVSTYFSNVEVFYNWQKFDSILYVWEPILPLSKVNTLIIKDAGRYRLEVIAHVKNNFQNDSFTNDFCKMTFLSNEININDMSSPSYPIINTIYYGSCVGDSIVYYLTNKNATYSYQWIDKLGNIFNSDTFRTVLSDKIDTVINRNIGECVYDRNIKILKGTYPIDISSAIEGYNTGCNNHPIKLKLSSFDPSSKVDWTLKYDTFTVKQYQDSFLLNFKYSGIYKLPIQISNNCSSLQIEKTFYVEESVPKIDILGPSTVFEKTTQLYCINNPNPNNKVQWSLPKNFKYKVINQNNQSCIQVTFPKGLTTGWLKSTIYNNCSVETDSILILSKPKFLFSSLDQYSEESNIVKERKNEFVEFSIFPNPATNTIEIKGSSQFDQIEIIDILGRSKKMENSNNIFDISDLNSGYYILKVLNNHKEISKNTFIKIN